MNNSQASQKLHQFSMPGEHQNFQRFQPHQSQDSFRGTAQNQMDANKVGGTKVVDLSHLQPFSGNLQQQKPYGSKQQLDMTTPGGMSDEQYNSYNETDQSPDQPYLNYNQQYQVVYNEENENQVQELTTNQLENQQTQNEQRDEYGNEGYTDLDQEIAYHQQIIDELVQENQGLQTQLKLTEQKLTKVEQQLQKTKQWIKELGNIKEDIVTLKQSAEEVEEMDNLVSENEILKAKLSELETKVNTLSRSEEDIKMNEKRLFEKRINELVEENSKQFNLQNSMIEQMRKLEEQIENQKNLIQVKDSQIFEIERSYQNIQNEHFITLKEHQELCNKFLEASKSQNSVNPMNQIGIVSDKKINSRKNSFSKPNQEYVSIRNRSISGEKGTASWMNNLKNEVEEDYKDRKTLGVDHQPFQSNESQIISNREKSQPDQYLDQSQINQDKENWNQNSKILTKIQQPVQITVSSPNQQTIALVQRCQKLEEYCRELIQTNKILDCENRLAIAQIIHLTDINQLNNLSSALNLVTSAGKIYEQRKSSSSQKRQQLTSNRKSLNVSQMRKQSTGKKAAQSINNLNTLRQIKNSASNFSNNQTTNIMSLAHKLQSIDPNDLDQKIKLSFRQTAPSQPQIFKNSQVVKVANPAEIPLQIQNSNSSFRIHNVTNQNVPQSNQHVMSTNQNPQIITQKNQQLHQMIQQSQMNSFVPDKQPIKSQNNTQQTLILDSLQPHQQQDVQQQHYMQNQNSVPLLDQMIEDLTEELKEKFNIELSIQKVTEGYYQFNNQVVNLRVDQEQQNILLRLQSQEQDKVTSRYVDFIDYLVENGFIMGVEAEEGQLE